MQPCKPISKFSCEIKTPNFLVILSQTALFFYSRCTEALFPQPSGTKECWTTWSTALGSFHRVTLGIH